ncbi:MAG: PQQ-binding-like beta-propeller repeat protein, partial [Candidatus Obscuribacterales bacterium]|nr:PQQ-binding-like beta-propeller repeat protein [Candidatus Obscuribacterales bacterium]
MSKAKQNSGIPATNGSKTLFLSVAFSTLALSLSIQFDECRAQSKAPTTTTKAPQAHNSTPSTPTAKTPTETVSPQTAPSGDANNYQKGHAEQSIKVSPTPSKDDLLKGTASTHSKYKEGWKMFLQNPCHTGSATASPTAMPIGKMKWTFPAEGPIDSSPAIYKGVVYVGSDDHFLYAVDERNGRFLWKAELGSKVKSSPAVGDDIVVVGCEDGKIYGVNPADGKVAWSYATSDRVSSSPCISDGVAFIGGWDGIVYALNTHTGKPVWTFPANHIQATEAENKAAEADHKAKLPGGIGRITASPALASNVIIIASHLGDVYCLSTHDGSMIWKFKTAGKVLGSPMIMNGLVYFGSWDKTLYALDLQTGAARWKFKGQESFSITPSGANGRIFAGNDDHLMYCLDAHSGKMLWKTPIQSPVPLLSSSPAVTGNMLYCG